MKSLALIAVMLCLAGIPAAARDVRFQQLDPHRYQSFVANWTPEDRPFCAVLRSAADWNRVLKPAPTMGGTRPFAPPAAFWRKHAILLLARILGAGDTATVFQVERVARDPGALRLDYRFAPTPPASSTMKWYLAVAVAKPLPPVARFREDGKIVCTVTPPRHP
ncbi:MAG TPA: hypothetical protein VIJ42_15580 [Stellaceae bacterium]